MKKFYIILILISLLGCSSEPDSSKLLSTVKETPKAIPIDFKKELIPKDKLIHKGIFSPDFQEYYYTLSDKGYHQFDVYVIKNQDGKWSAPQKAFFNSDHNEHGMSFSPDGKSIYFSSTRPTNVEGIPITWHIWKSSKVNEKWTEPMFVDIPNLRDKLVSHPSLANSGTMYFHASNLDYTEMDIYYSKWVNGKFEDAIKTPIEGYTKVGKCTPFISPNEDYLLFASIENHLNLMVSYHDGKGGWEKTKMLNKQINNLGQGNPYVTPDNKFLFFTVGNHSGKNWRVKWVNIEDELKLKHD